MNQVYQEIENHIPDVRRYALALTRDAVAADDLVQDSLTRALAKSDLFRKDTNLRAWLLTITHNNFVSNALRDRRTGISIDPEWVDSSLASEPRQEDHMVVQSMHKALDEMPDSQSVPVLMAGIDGMTYDEIAAHLDVPVGTVKSRVHRGRKALHAKVRGRVTTRRQPQRRGRRGRSGGRDRGSPARYRTARQ